MILRVAVVIALGVLAALPARGLEAFELLERVRQAYADLAGYRDSGVIEAPAAGVEGAATRLRFETAAAGERWSIRFYGASPGGATVRAIWGGGGEISHYDAELGQLKSGRSLSAEIVRGFGAGSLEALVVPVLLAGRGRLPAEPDAAALDGREPCGPTTCHVLVLSWRWGATEARWWVDGSTYLIRRVEVRGRSVEETIAMAMGRPGTGAGPSAASGARWSVRHEIASLARPPDVADLAFAPPASARWVERWVPEAEPRTSAGSAPPVFADEISVDLLTLAVRVVERDGEPIRGLGPEDFVVRYRKREVPVVSAEWVSPWSASAAGPGAAGGGAAVGAPSGSLVVLWVQTDVNAVRIKGHMRMLPFARELLESLAPSDLAALVSFDSHLKLWRDFTRDRGALAGDLERAIRFGARPDPARGAWPSLGRHLDREAARRAATPERALELVADALRPLPGEKVVVFLGWGLGRWGSSGFSMTVPYERALAALDRARATVFVLDVTDADYHTLEIGLRQVAMDTGGTYAKTNRFAAQAAGRLARTLGGHYLLILDQSGLPESARGFDVELRDRRGTVLVRSP